MDAASFQRYLQSSVLNTHPPQTFQARQQHHTVQPHQRYAIVPFAPRFCGCTMASTGAPHSFFADAMHHHRDEQTICEEYLRQPLALQPPAVPNFAFRPWVPPESAPATQRPAHPGDSLRLQVPGVLADEIKTEDFSPISDYDWAHASIEYEVPSPASAASMVDSPVTPEFSGGAESYNDRFLGGGLRVDGSSGLAYAQELGFDAKPFIPPGRHSVAPAALQLPGYDHDLGTPMFVHINSSADPYAETTLAAADQAYGLPTFHGGRISDAHLSAHHLMTQPPILAGHDMFRESHLSISDSDDASSLRSRPSVQKPAALVSTAEEIARARERDEILVQRRSEGWTYRKIKNHYRFPEAEPTLRGRHRMLTKEKEERVRRPVWTRRDVCTSITLRLTCWNHH